MCYELVYPGKMDEKEVLAGSGEGKFLRLERVFSCGGEEPWRNLLVFGDNLEFLRSVYQEEDPLTRGQVKGKVNLIYIDPPFATSDEFRNQEGAWAYQDKRTGAKFLEFLRRRLILAREILAPDGSIFLHLDQKMSHPVKVIMDEVFGRSNFRNEIAWCYTGPSQAGKYFPRKHDTILFYSRSADYYFDPPRVRHKSGVHNSGQLFGAVGEETGKKEAMEKQGKRVEDWWTDIWSCDRYRGELAGYPTQKPEELLRRIILAATREGDLVMDFFAGSGTTAVAAEKLGRRWVLCDEGKLSIAVCQRRLLAIGEGKDLKSIEQRPPKYGKECGPFGVYRLASQDEENWSCPAPPGVGARIEERAGELVLAVTEFCSCETQTGKRGKKREGNFGDLAGIFTGAGREDGSFEIREFYFADHLKPEGGKICIPLAGMEKDGEIQAVFLDIYGNETKRQFPCPGI